MLTFYGMNLDFITLYFFFYEGSDSESLTWYCIQVSYKLDDKTLETENLGSLKLICFALILNNLLNKEHLWSTVLFSFVQAFWQAFLKACQRSSTQIGKAVLGASCGNISSPRQIRSQIFSWFASALSSSCLLSRSGRHLHDFSHSRCHF